MATGIEFDRCSVVASCQSICSNKLTRAERQMAHNAINRTFGPHVTKTTILKHPKRMMCKITFATQAECAQYLRHGPRFINVTRGIEISVAAFAHNATVRAREEGLVVVVNGNHYGLPSACLYNALSAHGEVWNIVRNCSNNTMVLMASNEGVANVLNHSAQLCVAYAGVKYAFKVRPFFIKTMINIEAEEPTKEPEVSKVSEVFEDYRCQLCCERAQFVCIQPGEFDAKVHFTLCDSCRNVLGKDYCLECSVRGKECTAMSMRVDWSSLPMLT